MFLGLGSSRFGIFRFVPSKSSPGIVMITFIKVPKIKDLLYSCI